MNISSNILKALVIGVAIAGATSCEKVNIQEELGIDKEQVCTEECEETGTHNHPMPGLEDCPTCGLG